MGVSKLIDFIIQQINNLIPFQIIFQMHEGVRYWCGKYMDTLKPGIHFKFPYLHGIYTETVVDTTVLLPSQSITTLDEKSIIIRGAIGYKIVDIAKYFNNVYDTKSAISDNACLVLRQQCAVKNFDEIMDIELGKQFRKLLQKQVDDYGLHINFFGLIEVTNSLSLKLFNEQVKLQS